MFYNNNNDNDNINLEKLSSGEQAAPSSTETWGSVPQPGTLLLLLLLLHLPYQLIH